MMVWTLALGLALFAPVGLFAQEPQARFRHLSVEQGLSHGAVHAILQDARGFLWIGTADGLNRYDGRSIRVLRHEPTNPNSLSSSNFGKILEDRAGLLWFATWGGGVNRFDPWTGTFTRFQHDAEDAASLSQDRIEVLYEDSRGGLWLGTEQNGLNLFDPASETFVRYQHDPASATSLSNDEVKDLWEDRAGNLWVGTNRGLNRFDRETETFVAFRHDPANPRSVSNDRIRAFAEDASGALWVGTRGGGLDRFDRDREVFEHFRHDPADPRSLSDDSVSRLWVDSAGTLWIGTYNGGLNRFDPATRSFVAYRDDPADPNSLSHDRVDAIYEDRSRNLWIGTRGGIDRLDLKAPKFTHLAHGPEDEAGLSHPSVRAIAEVPASGGEAVWIGTDGGGLTLADTVRGSFRHFRFDSGGSASLSSDRVWSLLVDRAGTLWVGTYESGLARLVRDGERLWFRRYRHDPEDPRSLRGDRVQTIFEDRAGVLWLGTTAGLHRVVASPGSDDLAFEVFGGRDGATRLSDHYVISVRQDRAGDLWVGTRNGLNRCDPRSGGVESFHHDPKDVGGGLSSNFVQVVFPDERRDSVLWLGTEGGGLNRFDVNIGRFRHYLVEEGLPGNVVHGILQDSAGDLWIATSADLSRFDPETETFRSYGLASGLVNHSFLRNAAYRSTRGEMFFGGVVGLTSFFPDRIEDNPFAPPVELVSVQVFNRELALDRPLFHVDEIELDWDDNFVTFEFTGLEYTVPESNRYAYWLRGVDPDWVFSGNRPYASYANLAPGSYTFRIKAANHDGVWNEEGRTLRVVVRPPYWQTWWFRIMGFAALVGLVVATVHHRTTTVRRRAAELEKRNAVLQKEIVERRRAEADREVLISELEAKNVEMERFTHTVSHDLKSPLVTIRGFLGYLKKDAASGDYNRVEQDAEQIERASAKMYRLVERLLELSRIGDAVATTYEESMSEFFQEAAEMVAGRIHERRVEVVIEPDMPQVFVDHVRMLQVAQNLIDNAVKFLGDQKEPRIEIGTRNEGGETVFFVRDNGQGIDPGRLDQVFKMFERLDADGEGAGIGLALVQRIVELHGGRIWAESEGRGRGATFCFTVPRPK